MALILHLTDIHIGKNQPTDDHKVVGLISYPKRHNRFTSYCATLKSLAKYLNGKKLDAVIVSGDITVANREDGFKLFKSLINSLGKSKPDNKNIIVVPGNHDVQWGVSEDSPEKYNHFINYIRKEGYTTSFIESVDKTNKKDVVVNFADEKIQIIPINTSHYCGSQTEFKGKNELEKIKKIISNAKKPDLTTKLESEINKLLLHDVSRVSSNQLEYLSSKIKSTDKSIFRVAVTHHPLSTVTISEELKTFESITNMGEIRNFLLENSFSVLLHGHKHKQAVFWELIPDLKKPYNTLDDQLPLLVVSGTQLSHDGSLQNDICRLIEITNDGISQTVKILPVNVTQTGGKINLGEPKTYDFKKSLNPINKIISGNSISDTYNSIIEHYHNEDDKIITNLICEVQNTSNKIQVPDKYPIDEKFKDDKENWIASLVDWWAKKKTSLDRVKFTHGGRLFCFGEGEVDQIQYIIDALISKEETSKGIAVLFNPDQDGIEENKRGPHFCLIQFFIKERENTKYLDCIAYFRKQEMRHWWLINVAEIINLQNKIIEALTLGKKVTGVKNGSITTIAALAYLGKTEARPLVALPQIDILYDDENTGIHYGLTDLAYSLLYSEIPNREKSKELWVELFDDMIPNETPDPNGVPIAIEGLKFLSDRITKLLDHKKNRDVETLVARLKELLAKNTEFNDKYSDGKNKTGEYTSWKKDCDKIITTLKNQITKIYRIKTVSKKKPAHKKILS